MLSRFSGQLWKDNQPAPFLISLRIFPDDNHLFISAREQVVPSYFYYNQLVMCHFAAEVLKKNHLVVELTLPSPLYLVSEFSITWK